MEIIFKHAWILFVLVTSANAFNCRRNAKTEISIDPELKKGYDKLFKNYLIFGSIPWIIIGIGDISGSTKYIFDFFYPAHLNPLVLLFHGYIIAIWILGTYWIYFGNGIAFITRYNAFFPPGGSKLSRNKITVRLFWTITVLCGIFAEIMMWRTGSVPLRFINK